MQEIWKKDADVFSKSPASFSKIMQKIFEIFSVFFLNVFY